MAGKRSRTASRDDSFSKIRALKCFRDLIQRIEAGWTPMQCAAFVQEDRSEYQHASRNSLVQVLTRFRDSLPPGQLLKTRLPDKFLEAAKEVEEGLDELKEMEQLYKLQMGRIKIGMAHEKNLNILMPTMTQEIRVAREILGGYADLKMDLGLTTRASEQVDVNVSVTADVTRYGKKSVEDVMKDPERRRKVLNVAERMLAFPNRLEVIDAIATEGSKLEDQDPEQESTIESEVEEPIDEEIEREVLEALEAEEMKMYPAGRGPGVDPDSTADDFEEAEGYPA